MTDSPLGLHERLEHQAARWLMGLPARLGLLLSGNKPVERDGLTLHPEVQLLLTLQRMLRMPGLSDLPVEKLRQRMRRDALKHHGEPISVGAVLDLLIDGAAGPLHARHYAPADDPEGAPLVVFLHGGAMVFGDFVTHDSACRTLCRYGKLHVLAVEYRLAPEHRFPIPIEDSLAAFEWGCAHAAELGADPDRVAIAGDSAGGSLAAVVSHLTVKERRRAPLAQLLICPAVDRATPRPSQQLFADGFFLTAADIDWAQRHYLGDTGADPRDPRISPLLAEDLSGLPHTLVVTAGFDPLRDEGEAYADALERDGTPVKLRRFGGLIHGFINMIGISRACRDATGEVAQGFRQTIDEAAAARRDRPRTGSER